MSDDKSDSPLDSVKSGVEVVGALIKIVGDHPDMKESGSNLAKSAKTLTQFVNVALLPIAAVNFVYEKARNYYQGKFQSDVEAVAGDIPPENLQDPNPSIVAPILQNLAFAHEEDGLRDMYLRLIATAMDGRVADKSHPAFAEIIKQLSGKEANLLNEIFKIKRLAIVQIRADAYDDQYAHLPHPMPSSYVVLQTHVVSRQTVSGKPVVDNSHPALIDNWVRLGLVAVDYEGGFVGEEAYKWVASRPEYLYWLPQDAPPARKISYAKGRLILTSFGEQFAAAVSTS